MIQNDACDFSGPLRLHRIDAWAFRIAIDRPVETSFGIMRSRPAVFVRLEASDGSFGFGEDAFFNELFQKALGGLRSCHSGDGQPESEREDALIFFHGRFFKAN